MNDIFIINTLLLLPDKGRNEKEGYSTMLGAGDYLKVNFHQLMYHQEVTAGNQGKM